MTVAPFDGCDLALELLDPGSTQLIRLFRHPGGDWDPPPQERRNLRVDPPEGKQADYAVLYTADTLPGAAIECGILYADRYDQYTWDAERAAQYQVVRYAFGRPALFIPIDGKNRSVLGLSGRQRASFVGYAPFRQTAHELCMRYGDVVHGLSWESFHRNQPGRVYALWHHHKATVDLRILTHVPYGALRDDDEWRSFLAANPDIEERSPSPPGS